MTGYGRGPWRAGFDTDTVEGRKLQWYSREQVMPAIHFALVTTCPPLPPCHNLLSTVPL